MRPVLFDMIAVVVMNDDGISQRAKLMRRLKWKIPQAKQFVRQMELLNDVADVSLLKHIYSEVIIRVSQVLRLSSVDSRRYL